MRICYISSKVNNISIFSILSDIKEKQTSNADVLSKQKLFAFLSCLRRKNNPSSTIPKEIKCAGHLLDFASYNEFQLSEWFKKNCMKEGKQMTITENRENKNNIIDSAKKSTESAALEKNLESFGALAAISIIRRSFPSALAYGH